MEDEADSGDVGKDLFERQNCRKINPSDKVHLYTVCAGEKDSVNQISRKMAKTHLIKSSLCSK